MLIEGAEDHRSPGLHVRHGTRIRRIIVRRSTLIVECERLILLLSINAFLLSIALLLDLLLSSRLLFKQDLHSPVVRSLTLQRLQQGHGRKLMWHFTPGISLYAGVTLKRTRSVSWSDNIQYNIQEGIILSGKTNDTPVMRELHPPQLVKLLFCKLLLLYLKAHRNR